MPRYLVGQESRRIRKRRALPLVVWVGGRPSEQKLMFPRVEGIRLQDCKREALSGSDVIQMAPEVIPKVSPLH